MNEYKNNYTNAEVDCTEAYMRDISKHKLLSHEKEAELASRAREGDRCAVNELVKANLRFVVSVARNYLGQGLPMPDLIEEGNIGLINAARKYDERKNFRFVTFAVWDVRQMILKALAEQSRACRIPLHRSGHICKLSQIADSLRQKYKRPPSVEETANMTNMNIKDADIAYRLLQGSVSLNAPVKGINHNHNKGDEVCLEDSLYDEDAPPADFEAEQKDTSRYMDKVLDCLTEKEKKTVRLYYGFVEDTSHTLDEIGAKFNLSRERVRQIKEKAIRKLKRPYYKNKFRPVLQSAA
jgi:RNA polymerase primary sigma factor